MLKMSRCISCSSSTNYVCLSCKKSACNKSKDCSVPADEETPGWKAGISVAYCISCFKKKTEKGKQPKKEAKPLKQDKKQNELPTRKCLSLREKVEVIHASKELAQSARQLAKRFGCGKTQIAQILARKDTILEEWTSNGTGSHKRSNNEKFEKINHLLWEWYIKARGANIPVDGPLLKEEARLIAEQLGETSFKGTDGWLAKWKKRHNIALLNIAGEEGDVSQETVESWSERVKELTRGFAPEDIWNEDETGTFWKALPTTSLAEKGKRCQGGKNAKQRITAAFFVNAAGAKESPILIGKSQKPRCFSKLQDISRPCGAQYFNNDKAWMRTEIMSNVITNLNSKMKRENRHIILFLDNASCHPSSLKGMFSNVQIEFLPKNTTSRTQPLDAGIIKTWKMYYKRKLLRHVASEIDGKKTASEIVKSVNLLMAIRWMVSTWEEVPSEVISKCFKHVGMYPDQETEMDDDPFAGEELLEIEELLSRISPDLDVSFVDVEVDAHEPPVDTTLPNWREKMRNDILGASEGTEASDEESILESEELKTPEVSSVKGALELSKKLLDFSDWQGDEKLSQAITRVNDALTDLQLKSLKQSSIRSYLS